MRFRDWLPTSLVVIVGLSLCAANLWVVAARSTIPLAISGRVIEKQIRREKHPGKDDVHLIRLDQGRLLHVDQPIFEAVSVGQPVEKLAWSRRLQHGDQLLGLTWSADVTGMAIVMPLAALLLALMACVAVRSRRTQT